MEKPKTIRKPKKPISGSRTCIKPLTDYLYLSNYDVSSISFGELKKEVEKFCMGNDIKDQDGVDITIAIDINDDPSFHNYSSNDSEAYLYYIKEDNPSEYEEKMKKYEEDLKDYQKRYKEYKKKKKEYDEWKKEQDRIEEIKTIKERLKELEA